MNDFQYEVLDSIKRKDITSVDIDYIKDKHEFRVGFGRLTENFFNNDVMKSNHYDIKDFKCDLKTLLGELVKTEKSDVVVGFKNMMHDLYTIVTGERPSGHFHIGEFFYEGEDDKFLSILREVSLVNKLMFQLRLNKKETYSPDKAIRIGKYYMKNFDVVLSLKTNYKKGKELEQFQYQIFSEIEEAYKKLNVKPKLYLIPDKSSSTKLQTKFIELDTAKEVFEHKDVLHDYELNNVLRNAIFNLIVFLIRTQDKNASKEWDELVKKLPKVSGVSQKGEVLPDLFTVYTSYSIFINDKKMNIKRVAQILSELYQMAQSESHTQSKLVKSIVQTVDKETMIRFYEFYFTLKETGGNEVRVNFTEIESIFNMALDKVGEYFGLYKMKYSQDIDYLYNDVALHLVLTYTKTLIEEVFKKLSPSSFKRLKESGDSINIENILKMLIAKYFDVTDIEKLLKINTYTVNTIVKGLSRAGITNKSYRFNLYINNSNAKKILLSQSSFLTLNTTELLNYLKVLNAIILVDEKTHIYGDNIISNKLVGVTLSFNSRSVRDKKGVTEVYSEVSNIINKLKFKLGSKYNITPFLLIKATPLHTDKLIIEPPKMITVKTLNQLVHLGVEVQVEKILIVVENIGTKKDFDKASFIQKSKLNIMIDSLNIISTIPLPYTHLITNIIKELILKVNVFKLVNFLIKNKFLTEGSARYLKPSFKFYSYFILAHMSALIFNSLINTAGYIDKNKFDKTYIIIGSANSISVNAELIINTTMIDREGVKLLNGLVRIYRLDKTNVKIFYNESNERVDLVVFSVPIQDLLTDKGIPTEKLIERVNYNVIMSYSIDKTHHFKKVVRTSSRVNIPIPTQNNKTK